MSVPICDHCHGWIEVSNRTFPGYCSPGCRDAARVLVRSPRRCKGAHCRTLTRMSYCEEHATGGQGQRVAATGKD